MAIPALSSRSRLETVLQEATTWAEWHQAAQALDRLEGNDAWCADDRSPYFDAESLRADMAEFQRLRQQGQAAALEAMVTESLHRHLTDVGAQPLYEETHTGETKQIIGFWLDACVDALRWLRDAPIPGASWAGRRDRFARARANLGQTALLLSGGGAWGLYHLGVVRALRAADLMPEVLCGSSMGAIIAAGVCTRNSVELDALYDEPGRIHRVAVRILDPRGMLQQRSLLSAAQLREHVVENVGDRTFAEAWAHSGRVLNVSISPTRARQKPRVLSHLTAPEVLVADATVASCSIPGLFPPVVLQARTSSGAVVPYLPGEKWVDGSMQGDLPMQRLARLHNVNHFIVSQANPFVLPFVIRRHHGPIRTAARVGGALVRAQVAAVLDEARRYVNADGPRNWLDMAHALAGQHYGGDITIHPRVPPTQYLRVMANPSLAQLQGYIVGGERATWPRLAMIRNQTRVARVVSECVAHLDRLAAAEQAGSQGA